jgi:hypothetical protein
MGKRQEYKDVASHGHHYNRDQYQKGHITADGFLCDNWICVTQHKRFIGPHAIVCSRLFYWD